MKGEQIAKGFKDDGVAFLNPWGRRIDRNFVCVELAAARTKSRHPGRIAPPTAPHGCYARLMETGEIHGVQNRAISRWRLRATCTGMPLLLRLPWPPRRFLSAFGCSVGHPCPPSPRPHKCRFPRRPQPNVSASDPPRIT